MNSNSIRTKRVFISDIHMGDKKSYNPGEGLHPYVWLYPPRTDMLADFLKTILESDDVKELIILGDLFDQWVCPTEFDPTIYAQVAEAPQNQRIIEMLKKIDAHQEIDLYYVLGNHDMLLEKTFMTSLFPNIHFVDPDANGWSRFCRDGIIAEHGSMFTMFCSPDTWSHPGNDLPLGFFISRSVAYKNAITGSGTNFLDILAHFISDLFHSPELAKDVFEAIAQDSGLEFSSLIQMAELNWCPPPDPPSTQPTVEQVSDVYAKLFESWGKYTPTGLSSIDGVICEMVGLAPAAQKIYFKENKAPIVIFGHTHKYLLDGYLLEASFPDSMTELLPCKYIYANTGTWINSHPYCTYVETEIKDGKHYVRLFEYVDSGEKKKLKERFVEIK
ncbi:MAG: metallophosphoesterase [Acidobacteria bacterium]|jgi:UDP-2,3-diacylglucosamine pyrophosphatase LpxH|nr:metallophosphoesterase [Acidobacteriota bacterium]